MSTRLQYGYALKRIVSKQCIKGTLVNFICEAKAVSGKDVLIMITCNYRLCNDPKYAFQVSYLSLY